MLNSHLELGAIILISATLEQGSPGFLHPQLLPTQSPVICLNYSIYTHYLYWHYLFMSVLLHLQSAWAPGLCVIHLYFHRAWP